MIRRPRTRTRGALRSSGSGVPCTTTDGVGDGLGVAVGLAPMSGELGVTLGVTVGVAVGVTSKGVEVVGVAVGATKVRNGTAPIVPPSCAEPTRSGFCGRNPARTKSIRDCGE